MIREMRKASVWMRCARRCEIAGSVSVEQRLGEKPDRAHRRLQLVADVRDEVAPHLLEPAPLGDVVDDRDRCRATAGRCRCSASGPTRVRRGGPYSSSVRSSEAPGDVRAEQLLDRLGGESVAMAAADECEGAAVAKDRFAVLVTDDHGLGEGIECPAQPDGVCARVCDRLGRMLGRALDVTKRILDPLGVSRQRVGTEPIAEGDQSLLERVRTTSAADGVRHANEYGEDGSCDRQVENGRSEDGDHGNRRRTGTPPALQFGG